ncbi:MAG: hypothetical protein CUN56_00440 [Phototrophicales bacterium]|nr:MAG: hypothetical protein CUN56_00440 [Phototrophicales bacterium]
MPFEPRPKQSHRAERFSSTSASATHSKDVPSTTPQAHPRMISRAYVLHLQRTRGNAATQRLLAKRGTRPRAIQRKVGFEFEDGSWRSYTRLDNNAMVGGAAAHMANLDLQGVDPEERAVQPIPGGGMSSYHIMVPDSTVMGTTLYQNLMTIPSFQRDVVSLTGQRFPNQTTFDDVCYNFAQRASTKTLKKVRAFVVEDARRRGQNTRPIKNLDEYGMRALYHDKLSRAMLLVDPNTVPAFKLGQIEGQYGKADPNAPLVPNIAPQGPPRQYNVPQQDVFVPHNASIDSVVNQYGVEHAGKKGALHQEAFFQIEADGPYPATIPGGTFDHIMDIEVVTEPFEEDQRGYEQLKGTLKRMKSIFAGLQSFVGRRETQGEFVTPDEHGFNNTSTFLAGGSPNGPQIKMQVTQGVPIEHIPILMQTFGTPTNETPQEHQRREPAREGLYRNHDPNTPDQVRTMIGDAPSLADRAIQQLKNSGIIPNQDNTSKLRGFLSMMYLYVQSVHLMDIDGIKTQIAFLSRYSFDQLAQLIPPNHQAALRDNVDEFVNIFCGVLGNGYDADDPLISFHRMRGDIYMNHREFVDMIKFLKIGEWVREIFENSRDILSARGITDFLSDWWHDEDSVEGYQKALGIFTRGHGDASRVRPDGGGLAVLENRMIDPKVRLSPDDAEKAALAYFEFLMTLRASGAQPHFPAIHYDE